MNEFGKTVLAVHSLLESSLVGAGLTNREMNGKMERLYKKHEQAIIDYLDTQDEEAYRFLEECNKHINDIFNMEWVVD